jgi:hypothetical protein
LKIFHWGAIPIFSRNPEANRLEKSREGGLDKTACDFYVLSEFKNGKCTIDKKLVVDSFY